MKLITESYTAQKARWPQTGRHILAQYDEETIVVYQAYRPEIGRFAAEHQYFGGEFSLSRMSWIKPNFLWMMYRCGWASKEGQQVVLAVRLKRANFDQMLSLAVYSSYQRDIYKSDAEWQTAVAGSSVRLQWDPDHDPSGSKLERRAIQLGLRREILSNYAREWIVDIEDISDFVRKQRENINSSNKHANLFTPCEEVYPVTDSVVAERLRIVEFNHEVHEGNIKNISHRDHRDH